MNLVWQLLWRVYQMALIIFGMFLFYTIFGDADLATSYWFWKILAAFVFAFFVSYFGTFLTVWAIDHINRVYRNNRFDNLP